MQHECSTPNGIKGTYTLVDVIGRNLTSMCSTPNGIKGTYTLDARSLGRSFYRVLNA